MEKSLFAVVAVGLAIGFLLPSETPSRAEPDAPPVAAVSTERRPEAPPAAGWRPAVETRLRRGPSGHFYATARVNGQPVEFVVDTGATTVALTVADARRIGIPVNPAEFQIVGSGASGPVRGQTVTIDRVDLDGKEVRSISGVVLEGLDVSLLGQSYLSQITGVTMSADEMILS
jgi:aspartyl protease family protein